MQYSQPDLRQIFAQASPLAERLSAGWPADAARADDRLALMRLERWRRLVADGDEEVWQKYLAWEGLDGSAIPQALGAVRLSDEHPLPAWASTLADVFDSIGSSALDQGACRFLKPAAPLPFEELLAPFVHVARGYVEARAGTGVQLLSETAYIDLDRRLLATLAMLSAQSFELEFSLFRASRRSLSRLLAPAEGGRSREQYQAFVARMLGGQLLSFFKEYSVLARLMAAAVDAWVDTVVELIARLAADWPALEQTFNAGGRLGQVVAVSRSLSDPHNHGRMVCSLTFASGLQLIYKPKDLGIEQDFFELLAWCNARGVALPFKLPRVLQRTGYGWVEHVVHTPCQTVDEARRFYERAGMLLCLVYALQGTDCHYENLIACGEHPVLVDMEMLLQAKMRDEQAPDPEGETARSLAHRQLWDSVLATGLLPRWEYGPDGRGAYDASGLGGVGQQQTPYRWTQWKDVNTDAMALTLATGNIPPQQNAPILDGVTLSPRDYLDELVRGFREMYGFLLEQRAALLVPGGPVDTLARHPVRYIFRATKAYGMLLTQTQTPRLLRDGADHSIEFDFLSRGFLASNSRPHFWPLLRIEKAALERLDVPFFLAPPDGTALWLDGERRIEHFFGESGYQRVCDRFSRLDADDLERQIGIIRSSFDARGASATPGASRAELPVDLASDPLPRAALVRQAIAIAEDLRRRAIWAANGSCSWIGMSYSVATGRFQLQPLDEDFYNGCAGIALFLAALEHVTGGAGFRDLALAAIQPLRQSLHDSTPAQLLGFARQIGIGGATGLGSLVYVLVRVSQLLGEPALLDDARAVAALITPERIADDRELDIIGGAAGAILGLLALYERAPEAAILDRAIGCGRHLLDARVGSVGGHRAWRTAEDKLLTGFAHGAAGIAYALLRLSAVAGDRELLAAAQEAIAYERSVFSEAAGNWPDYRSVTDAGGKPTFGTSWCNGAAGIGLARLGGLPMLDTANIRADIAIAVQATLQASLAAADHLCCGSCGRIELLWVAANRLGLPELGQAAQQRAAQLLALSGQAGAFRLFHDLPRGVYSPGFFQGAAGIGYELLRLAHPDQVPSALLWE